MAGYKNPPETTRFQPGQSGNPGGGSRKASIRSLIRKAMMKAVDDGSTTAIEKWVGDLMTGRDVNALVLDVLKFTDGASPTEDPNDGDEAKRPRINPLGCPTNGPGGAEADGGPE